MTATGYMASLTAVYTRACISVVTQTSSPFMGPDHGSGKLPYVGVETEAWILLYDCAFQPPSPHRSQVKLPICTRPSPLSLLGEESAYTGHFGWVLAHTRDHITCTVVRCTVVHGRQVRHGSSLHYLRRAPKILLKDERKGPLHAPISEKRFNIGCGTPPMSIAVVAEQLRTCIPPPIAFLLPALCGVRRLVGWMYTLRSYGCDFPSRRPNREHKTVADLAENLGLERCRLCRSFLF